MVIAFAIHVLEAIFLIGLLGCAVVIALTTVEDVEILFGRQEPEDDEKSETSVIGANRMA